MKTIILYLNISIIIFSCSRHEEKNIILTKTYYPVEKVTRVSEIDIDSVLNGKTVWYDSLGKIYLEEYYLKGVLSGISKEYYNNGIVSIENKYYKGKVICTKEYSEKGTLIFQNPIDIKKIGPLKIIINDGERDYLIKNQEDKIEFKAENLPSGNQTISSYNATLRMTQNGWITTPSKRFNKVYFYLGYRKDYDSKEKIIDSAIVEIK
jgi:antitoxin component YwqK of YwqJK toxin-antitoxin module